MTPNQVSMLGQQPNNNTQSNQTGSIQSTLIGDLGTNSHGALSSPAKGPLGGATSSAASVSAVSAVGTGVANQISGDAPYNSYGVTTNASSASGGGGGSGGGSGQPTTNSTHDITAPSVPQTVSSTWSKFAQQSGPSQAIENTKTIDSFQQFKKQAREKKDKEKFIEMQEQARREREQQEREQQQREQQEKERLTQEQKIDQEGEMALNSLARSEQSPVLSPASDSQSPASGAGTSGGISGGGSSMLALREQERRRREALASQNQMDLSRQSEIMSKFEDRV